MIITVTLNPSVDRTLFISNLKRGSVNRANLISVDPGGKGVNVSRAVKAFGKETHAILVCGLFGSRWFSDRLNEQNISHNILLTAGVTRNNLTLVDGDGSVTKINEPGLALTDSIITEVKSALNDLSLEDTWVVFAGRLNPGANSNTYKDLAEFARKLGARVAIDASGEALKQAIEIGPDLIKPNQHELAELVGKPLVTIHDVVEAAKEIISKGVKSILCSLGSDGAIFISEKELVHVEPDAKVAGIPVGAGDILLATFIAGGADVHALPAAVSWSTASVPLEGTAIPTSAQARNIKTKINNNLEHYRPLLEVN